MTRILGHIFVRPYAGLPYAVFAFFVLCFLLHPQSPIWTHRLADPDDYMRLNQVAAWLQGQDWYDLSVPRLSPGAHTVIHWSRLIDVPIALLAWPVVSSLGVTNAVFAASLIVPVMLFLALLALVVAVARQVVNRDDANLASVFVLFAPVLLFNFTLGRVDHHGAQALIAGFGLLALARIFRDDKGICFAVFAALFMACGFWIGAESLPWVILFLFCLAFAAAWQGGSIARDGAVFGFCLAVFTAALIPVALPAAEYSSRALSWFSPAYALFAALGGGVLVAGWATGQYVPYRIFRIAAYGILGLGAVWAFFVLVPSALRGPFADYDAFDATTALDHIAEAQPLRDALRTRPAQAALIFVQMLALPLTALIVALVAARRAMVPMRFIWLAFVAYIAAAIGLTVFYQTRVAPFMQFFALAPLVCLFVAWRDSMRWKLWDRSLFWAEIGAFLLLGALPTVILPALATSISFYPDMLLFPAARPAPVCDLGQAAAFLAEPWALGAHSLTVLNAGNDGPELLFRTPHKVIAGNFDVAGNQDVYDFFRSVDDARAQDIAKHWQADLVLVCRQVPRMYVGKDYALLAHRRLQTGKDGKLHLVNTDVAQPLLARLIKGNAPNWLKPVEIPGDSGYLLFRIQSEDHP